MEDVPLDDAGRGRRLAWFLAAAALLAATTGWAMYQEIVPFWHPTVVLPGQDFWNNTWRAVRGLLSGVDIYGPTHSVIPGVEHAFPVAEHVPASLFWQAPFAALPIPAALFAFTFCSIVAIWAGIFILTRPRSPATVMLAVCCGTFAILAGGGPWTLLLGQPTGFILLGIAIVVRARRPWVGAAGFLLAASTVQVGLPLALALIVLGGWPVVWRGALLVAACSLPPVAVGMATVGPARFADSFIFGGARFLAEKSHRIDLGALLHRAGVGSSAAQLGAGLVVLVLALLFLARLPAQLRRMDYPPALCLVIAVTLLCTYHEIYDILLVGGVVLSAAVLTGVRSVAMLAVFGLAGVSAGLSGNGPVAVIVDPICLVAIVVLSALAAHKDAAACRTQPTPPATTVADALLAS